MLSDNPYRVLVHFSDGGSGMREHDRSLELDDELQDGGQQYRVVRVEPKNTSGGFGHLWAEIRQTADGGS
jgi:hypothetical protein